MPHQHLTATDYEDDTIWRWELRDAAGVYLALWTNEPNMTPLYAGLAERDVAEADAVPHPRVRRNVLLGRDDRANLPAPGSILPP